MKHLLNGIVINIQNLWNCIFKIWYKGPKNRDGTQGNYFFNFVGRNWVKKKIINIFLKPMNYGI